MSWIRHGTISTVNGSTVVNGVDCLWSIGISPGASLYLVDGNGNPTAGPYEIASIQSNTRLTLAKPFPGTTGSARAYAISNTVGDQTVSALANDMTKFYGEISELLDQPQVTPVANSIPVANSSGKISAGWLPDATAAAKGVVQLATTAEAQAGTDATRAVTPATLAGACATNAEALAGTTKKLITAESLRYVTLNTLYNIEQAPAYCGVSSEGGWHRIKEDGTPFHLRHDIDNAKGIHRAFTHLAPWAGIETRIITSSAGPQQVVRIPKFWYKRQGTGLAGDPYKLWISGVERSGYALHPAFAVVDEFFVGAFACGGDKYESVEGLNPKTNITIGTAQSGITTNHGAGWNMWDIYQLSALQMLYLVEFGHPDAQKLIGAGNSGRLWDGTYRAAPNGKTNAVYRGVHEFWGNVWQMVDGLRGYSGTTEAEIFKTDGSRTFARTGITPPASNSGSSMLTNAGTGFDLKAVNMYGPAGQAHFADNYWGPVNSFMTLHGGNWYNGSNCGVFSLPLSHSVSDLTLFIGSRLAKV